MQIELWCVVTRPARNYSAERRGKIVLSGVDEETAKDYARRLAKEPTMRDINVWAMPRKQY